MSMNEVPNYENDENVLQKFGRIINDDVKKGKIDPVIGRDEEIRKDTQNSVEGQALSRLFASGRAVQFRQSCLRCGRCPCVDVDRRSRRHAVRETLRFGQQCGVCFLVARYVLGFQRLPRSPEGDAEASDAGGGPLQHIRHDCRHLHANHDAWGAAHQSRHGLVDPRCRVGGGCHRGRPQRHRSQEIRQILDGVLSRYGMVRCH